jgi:hypothetical protein
MHPEFSKQRLGEEHVTCSTKTLRDGLVVDPAKGDEFTVSM